ncbi:hypothetical protein H0H93_008047 [Arthromyces matolae]|nr:hypothetical protein H0H93_008047 [Arthromyces matolae]
MTPTLTFPPTAHMALFTNFDLAAAPGSVKALVQSFSMIIVSEIGDKTFLIAAILAMRHPRLTVFLGAFLSLALMSLLSAALGHILPILVPRMYTQLLAGGLFLVFGAKMLTEARAMESGSGKIQEEMREAEEEIEGDEEGGGAPVAVPMSAMEEGHAKEQDLEEPVGKAKTKATFGEGLRNFCSLFLGPVFVQAFILTFLGEWGDRSQIATIALGAAHNMYLVAIGTVVGHSACTALAVIGGRYLSTKISVKHVTFGGAILFLLFGLIYLYEALATSSDVEMSIPLSTAILDSFDTRLAKLEKSILPLYTATQILNRRVSNIDKTLHKIDQVSSSVESMEEEEALILRGPQTGQLDKYWTAVERLNASIAFKTPGVDTEQTARLIETGVKKLTQLYTKLVAEVSSGSTPSPGAEWAMTPFPSNVLSTLRQLVNFLGTLPLPSTHPSHPAAQTILTTLQDAQRGYADMRGVWAQKCLEGQGRRCLDRADTIEAIPAGREFGKWVELVLVVCNDEYQLLSQLTPIASTSLLASSFATLLTPILKLFSSTVTSLVNLVKRSLPKYTYLALAAYETMLSMQSQWDELLSRRSSESRKDVNEIKDGMQAIRGVCLRSFPEFLADLKLGAMGRGGELMTTGLADFILSTVRFMEKLPQCQTAVESALYALGDGNWKMGEGVKVGKAGKADEDDEASILEHFTYDVVVTAVTSLNTLSRSSRRPALASIFLLNNVAYLRHHLILDPIHPSLPTLLPKSAHDHLNSNFRTAKAAYFDSNFSPLMQTLTDDPKEKSKSATKEKFTRFFDLLEEVLERHKLAKLMEDDGVGRETIGEEVVKLVIPALQRFSQKHRDKEFSKNPQKYIKMSPETVETQLKSIYR